MNEPRYMILWLDRVDMINMVIGGIRIANLPADCRIEAMGHNISRDAVGLRLWSSEFPLTHPGTEAKTLSPIFEAGFSSALLKQSFVAAPLTAGDVEECLKRAERMVVASPLTPADIEHYRKKRVQMNVLKRFRKVMIASAEAGACDSLIDRQAVIQAIQDDHAAGRISDAEASAQLEVVNGEQAQ